MLEEHDSAWHRRSGPERRLAPSSGRARGGGARSQRVCCARAQTNNPRKIAVLQELGVVVTERIPCLVQAQAHSLGYLTTKQVPARCAPHTHAHDCLPSTLTVRLCRCAACWARMAKRVVHATTACSPSNRHEQRGLGAGICQTRFYKSAAMTECGGFHWTHSAVLACLQGCAAVS